MSISEVLTKVNNTICFKICHRFVNDKTGHQESFSLQNITIIIINKALPSIKVPVPYLQIYQIKELNMYKSLFYTLVKITIRFCCRDLSCIYNVQTHAKLDQQLNTYIKRLCVSFTRNTNDVLVPILGH